jgi:hypothetical protein
MCHVLNRSTQPAPRCGCQIAQRLNTLGALDQHLPGPTKKEQSFRPCPKPSAGRRELVLRLCVKIAGIVPLVELG